MKRKIAGGQILLYIILLILGVFFGFGIYFTVRGVMNPILGTIPIGLIGLGLFVFGAGVIGFMQASLLRTSEDSFWKTFGLYYALGENSSYDLSAPKLRVEVRLDCGDWKGLCTLLIVKEGLYFRRKDAAGIRISYTNMSAVTVDKSRVCVTGHYEGAFDNSDDMIIASPTVLQSKAIYETIQRMAPNKELFDVEKGN